MSRAPARSVLLRGCEPEIAAAPDGRILAVGRAARPAAGRDALVHHLPGRAWPGLVDSHIHLHGLAELELTLDLTSTRGIGPALAAVARRADRLGSGEFLVGRGWSERPGDPPPHRQLLDRAAGGRPALLRRRDGHSAWLNTSALALAGITNRSSDPPGGVIERGADGTPSGIVREKAVELAEASVPQPGDLAQRRALERSLRRLSALGLTAVHSMDPVSTFALLQGMSRDGRLPVRVTYNFPVAELAQLERVGISSGWGDDFLRVWGIKAFLDGSLGSGTAEMLDGRGVTVMPQAELLDVVTRAARAELNVCLHAIGDRAVRRALDALQPHRGAWTLWRPRIEHAQCVNPDDLPRFAAAGAIASMQPIHAVSDRELAAAQWPLQAGQSYAWRALRVAGARLAFGSDAPVESADPLRGLEAATAWRRRAGWFPELALSRPAALAGYTSGAAYAAGMERDSGRLRPGLLCDVTVVDESGVVATVVGGRLSWRRPGPRRRPKASPRSGPGAR